MRRGVRTLATALLALSLPLSSAVMADTLVVGQAGDTLTLDPLANAGIVEASFASNFFEGLVTFEKDMNVVPALATDWELTAPDQWIFRLRPDV